MHRRGFLKSALATSGGELLDVTVPAPATPGGGASPPEKPAATSEWEESISMRGYLVREAARITEHALADFKDAATWRKLVPERRRQFLEMMGLEELPPYDQRPPLNVSVTGVVERPNYRIEKLYYESVPKLFVVGNLYIPNSLRSPAPAVLYVCGHGRKQKSWYQGHARRFAELGFVCLLIETIMGDEMHGDHLGPRDKGWFHWYSRGYTPAGIELLNGIRGLDLLVQRPEVDPKRLGVTGMSGGGAYSWWIAAGDERVTVSSPVCGMATLAFHIYARSLDTHCDCMWWINKYGWDLTSVGALIAPRPLLIASSDHDGAFSVSAIREVHRRLKQLYTKLGAPDNLSLVVANGEHGYHPLSRTTIFSWFLKQLQGKNIPPQEVGDVDERPENQELEETLRVYANGAPTGSRAPTIQDDFIRLAKPPHIVDVDDLKKARQEVIVGLRRKSFAAFPSTPPQLKVQVVQEFILTGTEMVDLDFRFTPEQGWRLQGLLQYTKSTKLPAPVVVTLRTPDAGFSRFDRHGVDALEFLKPIQPPWIKAVIELRGTGESACSESLRWHLRRAAAWTGRTFASMWVYDALRALACLRALPQVDGRRIAIAARGDMACVALYAALLDGHVETLLLGDPPATQNAPGQIDGRGSALEMLGCLRITDVAQVAGLLYPTELVFIGGRPSKYDWAEALYRRLGGAERFRSVDSLGEWRPS